MIPVSAQEHDIRRHHVKGRASYLMRLVHRARFAPWFWNKEFSTDWTTEHFTVWHRVLAPWRGHPLRILEIGSWEGRSTLFFLNYFRHSTMTCIDTFQGSDSLRRQPAWAPQIAHIEGRFDRNLAAFASRTEKIKSPSCAALDVLIAAGREFDLAYIDGDHRRDSVWRDTIRAWQLVSPGGIIIWDDYGWRPGDRPEDRPQPAIDSFLAEQEGRYQLLTKGHQVIVRRCQTDGESA